MMVKAQHREPDHGRGDANTIGGYAAVHDRPAAFEGSDGFSYSVELLADDTGEAGARRHAAYLFFVRWARVGSSSPMGHLESDYLAWGASEADALAELGALRLSEVTRILDELIVAREGGAPRRRWWDAMRAEDPGEDANGDGRHDSR